MPPCPALSLARSLRAWRSRVRRAEAHQFRPAEGRPPKRGISEADRAEYLYEPWYWTDYDNPPYETHKGCVRSESVQPAP